jgi:hypothetical protein
LLARRTGAPLGATTRGASVSTTRLGTARFGWVRQFGPKRPLHGHGGVRKAGWVTGVASPPGCDPQGGDGFRTPAVVPVNVVRGCG